MPRDPLRVQCWICGSMRTVPWADRTEPSGMSAVDLQITDARYGNTLSLRKCGDCGFVFSDDEDLSQLHELYEGLVDDAYESGQASRLLQMGCLLDFALTGAHEPRSLLDIGAGAGLMVRAARDRGIDAHGIEPSHSLVRAAERINRVHLIQGYLPHPELTGRRFDVVCLVDVIEHVTDPVSLLRTASELLAPEGVLLAVTPDARSVVARTLGSRWWHYRRAHVGYFDCRTFSAACERAGLRVRSRTRARWFFPMGYVADRLERYLPISRINSAVKSTRLGARMRSWVMPVNPRDSWAFLCVHGDASEARQ